LISQLHSRNLDRRKPLWEVHVIDGLDRGRFAIFTKAHHALFDGVSFLRLLRRALSTDRESREIQVLWSQRPPAQLQFPGSAMQGQSLRDRFVRAVKPFGELGRSVTLIRAALRERDLFPAFRAPPTIFNVAGDVPWVCATQSWQIDRIDKVKDAAGASVHDVALAMCAGALRAMLSERTALPERPLVAVVPVGLRTDDDVEGRNLMSSGVCNLATDLKDPVQRLKTVQASMRYNKQLLRALPRQVSMHLGGVISAPITDGSRSGARMSSQFNVGISHVADAHLGDGREALYLNGARLDGLYGFLPVLRGHSLFIALLSNAISLNFGIVGCAGVMPDHDCLLNHLEVSLRELEDAFGL